MMKFEIRRPERRMLLVDSPDGATNPAFTVCGICLGWPVSTPSACPSQ